MPLAIIVTQTCDLQNDERVRASPFINIVPAYDAATLFEDSDRALIRQYKFKFLVPLNGPALPQDETLWVADLRVDVCVDRAVLLGRTPQQGISDDHYIRACRAIGTYRARPAFSDDLREDHLKPLRTFLRSRSWKKRLTAAWIQCAPSALNPAVVRTFLLTDDQSRIASMQDDLEGWYAQHIREASGTIELRVPKVRLTAEFTQAERDGSLQTDELW
jgi:hypothetical protein